MNLTNIKVPLAIIGIMTAQSLGIVWYVTTLDMQYLTKMSRGSMEITSINTFD